MQILLTKENRIKLFKELSDFNSCRTMKQLSKKIKIPYKTLQHWKYGKDYITKDKIPITILEKLEIIREKENNWGQKKGGKKTYQIILQKYGQEEIKKRQKKGGKNSRKNKTSDKNFKIDLDNEFILEFYGALLGDGWISHFKQKNKNIYLFGFSGDLNKDKRYHVYLQQIIKKHFFRKGYVREKKRNARELVFCHEDLFYFFKNFLLFPIGKKHNLKIHKQELLQPEKFKYILKGIFDTDGSFYLDKEYPCISIQMKAPKLISQINNFLKNEGFKPQYMKQKNMITLKGKKQINKWIKEIGMSNERHIKKMLSWRNLDSATPS